LREPLVSKSFAQGLCLLLCAGAVAGLLVGCPRAAPVPLASLAAILIVRRSDLQGGLLYATLLSLLAAAAYGVCLAGALALGFPGDKVPVLAATLLVVKEVQRFLDNEYGDGRAGRRAGFALLAVAAAIVQILLVWSS